MHGNKQVCLNIFSVFWCLTSYEALVPLNFRHQLPCSEINALVPLNPPKGSNSLRY